MTALESGNGWRLEIPSGPAGKYRLAQLDDYYPLNRRRFPYGVTGSLSLRCRVSAPSLPGTWGFGFWNDPFVVSFGIQGAPRRLPVLPNAAWFFHASGQNHLSFRDHLPGNGFLAQAFSSPKIPSVMLAPALLAAPLLLSRQLSRWLRAACGRVIGEDSTRLELDATAWHAYRLVWQPGNVEFSIDGTTVFETRINPQGPLGLVIWIDNQFAAFTPDGRIGAGAQANPVPAWMEIMDLEISPER